MKTILLCILLLAGIDVFAQASFITAGKIEYERKLNLHKEIEEETWLQNLKDKIPKFRTSYHNLYFKDGKTLYEKGKENDEKIPFFGDDRSVDDVIYSDLSHGTFVKKQQVFDETFLLTDSIRHIKWQMTNEMREIAGFECHKAVGRILDSVYIVAFYTDQITVNGGPLSYTNLPGMILGVAIPRTNITIFATKVELTEPKPEKLIAPVGKMKKVDYKTFYTTLQKGISSWGDYGRKYMINFML